MEILNLTLLENWDCVILSMAEGLGKCKKENHRAVRIGRKWRLEIYSHRNNIEIVGLMNIESEMRITKGIERGREREGQDVNRMIKWIDKVSMGERTKKKRDEDRERKLAKEIRRGAKEEEKDKELWEKEQPRKNEERSR